MMRSTSEIGRWVVLSVTVPRRSPLAGSTTAGRAGPREAEAGEAAVTRGVRTMPATSSVPTIPDMSALLPGLRVPGKWPGARRLVTVRRETQWRTWSVRPGAEERVRAEEEWDRWRC